MVLERIERLTYDTESDGFVEEATVVHCICTVDVNSYTQTFHDNPDLPRDGTIKQGLEYLSLADELVCHNQLGHDLPLLKKLHDWEPHENTKITDTLVLSILLNPDRKRPAAAPTSCGPHGLEGWGYRVGRGKVSHEDWTVLSTAMLRRCSEDVGINESVYIILKADSDGDKWSHAIEIEHKVRSIINQQENDGVGFNLTLATELTTRLDEQIRALDDDLVPKLPCSVSTYGAEVRKPFLKTGGISKMVSNWNVRYPDFSVLTVGGPFTRIVYEPMNLGSMAQVKEYLLSSAGWQPTEWNYKDGNRTSPKLTEDSYGSISGDLGRLIKNRYLWSHRKSQIQGWINRLRPDGRLTAGAITCGTNTRRFRHINVVNVPKAKEYVYLGIEMRSLFKARRGYSLVGHDAAGLELRMLAHYMKDADFTEAVCNGREEDGTDIHSLNQRLAGLPTRDDAKTFIYAFLYGAGDGKIGQIVGGDAADGAKLKRKFLKNLPALARLIKRVKKASKRGWLRGIDGSRIFMRRDDRGAVMEHKALNTLLQSAGAIVMKESMVLLERERAIHCPRTVKVLDMHDEAQAEVPTEEVDKYMELCVWSIVQAGKDLKLLCPLDATAKKGKNWAETH